MGWLMPSDLAASSFAHARRRKERSWLASISSGFTWVPTPPYYDNLLALARKLVKERKDSLDTGIAVILCQMAAELLVERVLRVLLERKPTQIPQNLLYEGQYLKANLVNKRVRQFYESLSENSPLDQQPFWVAYKAHVKRRDAIVHRGGGASWEQAQESCDTVASLLEYLKQKHGVA
jgi:hypothetical protein